MMQLALLGLGIVVLAWIVQLIRMKKTKEIMPCFICLYVIGVILLIVDGFIGDATYLALLNLLSAVVALIVLIRIGCCSKK